MKRKIIFISCILQLIYGLMLISAENMHEFEKVNSNAGVEWKLKFDDEWKGVRPSFTSGKIDERGNLWFFIDSHIRYSHSFSFFEVSKNRRILNISNDGKVKYDLGKGDEIIKKNYKIKMYDKQHLYAVKNDFDYEGITNILKNDYENKVDWKESIEKWPKKVNNYIAVYDLDLNEVEKKKIDVVVSTERIAANQHDEYYFSMREAVKKYERAFPIDSMNIFNKNLWLSGILCIKLAESGMWSIVNKKCLLDKNLNLIDKDKYYKGIGEDWSEGGYHSPYGTDNLDSIVYNGEKQFFIKQGYLYNHHGKKKLAVTDLKVKEAPVFFSATTWLEEQNRIGFYEIIFEDSVLGGMLGYKAKYYRFGIIDIDGTLYNETIIPAGKESGLPEKVWGIDLKMDPNTNDIYLITADPKYKYSNKYGKDKWEKGIYEWYEIYKIKAPKKLDKPKVAGKLEGENPYKYE